MLPSVYTSCQESQTNRDLLLKGFLQQRPSGCCHLSQMGRGTLRGERGQEEPREGHSRAGGARLPHRPAHRQLLCLPAPCIAEKKPFSCRKMQSYETGPPETGLFSKSKGCAAGLPLPAEPSWAAAEMKTRSAPQPLPFLLSSLYFWG